MYLEKIFTKCWKLICKIVRSVDPMKFNKKLDVACRYSKCKQQTFQVAHKFLMNSIFKAIKYELKKNGPILFDFGMFG
ncbi:unnamed protein product [Tenebrio molitor]|nr:unnamed protein product [Tenebrio molitor]